MKKFLLLLCFLPLLTSAQKTIMDTIGHPNDLTNQLITTRAIFDVDGKRKEYVDSKLGKMVDTTMLKAAMDIIEDDFDVLAVNTASKQKVDSIAVFVGAFPAMFAQFVTIPKLKGDSTYLQQQITAIRQIRQADSMRYAQQIAAIPAGPKGDNGTAAAVSIGTVTTLAAGSPAEVTNTGSSSAAVLSFKIPAGIQGQAGVSWNSDSTQVYNAAGRLRQRQKEWVGIITPITANGQTIDISSAAFTTITSIQIQASNNTSSATSVPVISLKSYTTAQIVVNIVMSNSTLVSVLGSTVAGLAFATSLSGVTLHVLIHGY